LGLDIVAVRVWETPSSVATYTGHQGVAGTSEPEEPLNG
jgi:hypothetical protein